MQETLINALLLPRHARAAGTIFLYYFTDKQLIKFTFYCKKIIMTHESLFAEHLTRSGEQKQWENLWIMWKQNESNDGGLLALKA